MAENEKETRSLALTPTWSVALVLSIFVAVSLLVERSIHRLSNWLRKTSRKPLLEAVEKMKEELMLLGFISLLLTATSSMISDICIPSKFYDSPLLPAAGLMLKKEMKESLLRNGHEPFVSYEGLEQLHRFIFVMAVTHVSYSCLTMLLAIVKIHSWREWEDEAHRDRHDVLTDLLLNNLPWWQPDPIVVTVVQSLMEKANAHKEEVSRDFQLLLSTLGDWRSSLSGLSFESLDDFEVAGLEMPFEEEEVYKALLSFRGDKAPGSDGLSTTFWQFSWEFVKNEVMNFFREFHTSGCFVHSVNATFLVLIPKKVGPISLVGGLYKWLTKVLANRLKEVLAKVISKTQNVFVEGRQILFAVLIANEVTDSILKSNGGAVQCKLDIEKAYDHMKWSFLFIVMEKMGFGERWLRWVKWCLSTVNLDKSDLILVGRVENVDDLACELGCKVGSLPSTYLGMPLGAPFNSVVAWDGIEERFYKRLAM
ncbi:MLO-like protein 11 [Vitis vinifera]|uniref:MLO-like protein n=1 Tax=Vitis vinifera TaxID=29760 RepID=A0A438DM04_VITVI|nr:MLO-like protein 11 [Vitis vinifera]